jgi:hypothetical protein
MENPKLNGNKEEKNIEKDELFTITFSESVENHVGMEQIGEKLDKGFSYKQLKEIKEKFKEKEYECKIVKLNKYLPEEAEDVRKAYVLVIRNGLKALSDINGIKKELNIQKPLVDKKALMRGKVVNKHARWNLCYADKDQEPDYEEGKGRVINFKSISNINNIRKNLGEYTGHEGLFAELNHYYDINKCGIGFHGDNERKLVIGIRIGASLPLHYQRYKGYKPVGERCKIKLHDGDVYMMSDKAVGYDWKRPSIYTLRHATGCKKYTA